jgi:low temperature requirement protein LtrA
MRHGVYHVDEKRQLSLFASPLAHIRLPAPAHKLDSQTDLEQQQKNQYNASVSSDPTASTPEFENMDYGLHEDPSFRRHAEATTAELFYDLFFVGNLTTFTTMQEINNHQSLTAYIGFFSLLWLTWYQVSLYDVRFSVDSIFERIAKAIHFGVMVGFAVMGPQWKPGQEVDDYTVYKIFGLMLMVSRFTLFCQYGVTLFYTKKYKSTVRPLVLVMAWTLLAAVLYGALTPAFPLITHDANGADLPRSSRVYVAWYVIAISETVFTVTVSCYWRIISFKGTHMTQRMNLLTLIILGEGIIVVCKSISKLVKNKYLWSVSVVGQIIAGKPSSPHLHWSSFSSVLQPS